MKFSNILFMAGLAVANPMVQQVQPRGTTVIGTIIDTINEVIAVGEKDLGEIVHAIEVGAEATGDALEKEIEIIKEDLTEITEAIKEASDAIAKATAQAAQDIANGLEELAQEELEIFAEAVNATAAFIAEVDAVISLAIKEFGPATEALIKAELAALEAVLKPFVTPLLAFVDVLKKIGIQISLDIGALAKAGEGFLKVLGDLLNSLGLNLLPKPQVNTPKVN